MASPPPPRETEARDLYEVLDVPRTAESDEIRRAYRRLALECHPDRNQGSKEAEERFKELADAFRTLSDPDRRRVYDLYGQEGLSRRDGFRPEGPDLSGAVEIFVQQFSAFVQDELRDEPSGADGRSGAPRRVTVTVTLGEVATGVRKRVGLPCARCEGSGLAGEGTPDADPCRDCAGEGTDPSGEGVEIEVPVGVVSGETLPARLQDRNGDRSRPEGEITAVVEVAADPHFTRAGSDLVVEVPVPPGGTREGEELELETPSGPARFHVPAGTRPGAALTVGSGGLPARSGSGRGDLIVKLVAMADGAGDRVTRELETQVAAQESSGVAPRAPGRSPGLFSGVRNAVEAGRARSRRAMRRIEVRAARFLERERREPVRPLLARIERLCHAVEHAGEAQIVRLEGLAGRLSRDAARLRAVQADRAWGSPQGEQSLREGAWRSRDGVVAGVLLLLLAAGFGWMNVWALAAAAPSLFPDAGELPFPLSGTELSAALPALLTAGAFATGMLAQGLEGMEGGGRPERHGHLLARTAPFLLAVGVIGLHGLAFTALAEQVDLIGILGLSPGGVLAPSVPYLFVFAGAALAIVLMSLGYGTWLHLRQALAAAADRSVIRRLRTHRRRIAALPLDLEAIRGRIEELAGKLDALSREVPDAWGRATGLDVRDGTADALRGAAEQIAGEGSLGPGQERRSRGAVWAELAVGTLGFFFLIALGALLHARLLGGFAATGVSGGSATLLSLGGTLFFVLGGYLVRDALFGPSRAPSVLEWVPSRRGRVVVAGVVGGVVILGAAAVGWLAVQGLSPAAGGMVGVAGGALLGIGTALWAFNLDVWLLSAGKLAYLALLAAGWVAAGSVWLVFVAGDGLVGALPETGT